MQHNSIFDDKIVHRFNFKGKYIGYVLDNSEFESNLQIKVFIPELFGYNYTPAIKNIDKTLELSTNHIFNKDSVNITTQLNKQEYLNARILLDRSDLMTNKENFIKKCMPNIGEKVIVSFFNENPNNCVYINTIFLTDGESLEITEDNNTSSTIIKLIQNKKENKSTIDKIKWQYISN